MTLPCYSETGKICVRGDTGRRQTPACVGADS